MILREGARKALALLGCGFWLASSLIPLLGGNAKHAVRCRGRAFEGFDDCFNDALPVLEMLAPLAALLLLCLVAPLSFGLWKERSDAAGHDGYPLLGALGCLWAIWRAALYPLDALTAPYSVFWLVYASWFAAGARNAWYAAAEARHD